MSYFYYKSKKIYYTETGRGKPVLFLHGNTASSRMFEPLQPLYSDKFHVILMDFLGHGESSGNPFMLQQLDERYLWMI